MKLQLALDMLHTKEAIEIIDKTYEYIDIIEIGTPLIKHEGVKVLETIRKIYQKKDILVDLKTMDVGEYEADFCFSLGADIVTVLGVSDIETIKGSLKSSKKYNKKIMVDMINHQNKIEKILELNTLNVDLIGIHSGIDQQNIGKEPLNELIEIQPYTNIPLCIAGGINLSNIDKIIKENPNTIIIGGQITSSENPSKMAKSIKEKINASSR